MTCFITYLSAARLGQIADNEDLLGRSERPNNFPDLDDKLLCEAFLVSRVVCEFSEGKVRGVLDILKLLTASR